MSKANVICHVTDSFEPEAGGVERVVKNLAAQQVEAGKKVFVVTKSIQGAPARETIDGIQVLRFHRISQPTPRNYVSSYFGSANTVEEILNKTRVDVAHCHLTLSAQGPIGVFKKHKIPLVGSFYGPWYKEFRHEAERLYEESGMAYRQYLRLQIGVQKRLQQRVLCTANRLIVLSRYSQDQAEQLIREVCDKCEIIPGGVEERFSSGLPESDSLPCEKGMIKVLTVRRLVRRNGVDLLIDAVKLCKDEGLDLHLFIGGRGELEAELRKQAADLNVADRVTFLGFIEDEKLPDAYRSADLFVIPTRAEENFGLPIVESAACGTPVIGTAVGSIPEVLGGIDERMLAKSATAESIAGRIEWFVKNKGEVDTLFKSRADGIRREYSWKRIAGKVEQVYDEAIG